MMSPVCFIFLVFPLVSAETFHFGPCPTPSVQANFNHQRYLGRWYEIERLPSIFDSGKCSEANLVQGSDGIISIVFSETEYNEVDSIEGTVHPDPEEPAKMWISFHDFFPKTAWWVLSTDYTTTAAVYSCFDFFKIFHVEYASITSRTRSLAPDAVNAAKRVFLEEGIDIKDKMVVADQTGCGDE